MQTTILKLSALLVLALPATTKASESNELLDTTTTTAVATVILNKIEASELNDATTKAAATATEDKSEDLANSTYQNEAAVVSEAIDALVKPLIKQIIKKNINLDSQNDESTQITACTGADCKNDKKMQNEAANANICTTTTPETAS